VDLNAIPPDLSARGVHEVDLPGSPRGIREGGMRLSGRNRGLDRARADSPRANLQFPRAKVLFPRANIMFPRAKVLFPRANIMFPRANIVFARGN
jgi:hypothetical protein